MVGAFIMQGSGKMYKFDIKEISKEDALEMIQKLNCQQTNNIYMVCECKLKNMHLQKVQKIRFMYL